MTEEVKDLTQGVTCVTCLGLHILEKDNHDEINQSYRTLAIEWAVLRSRKNRHMIM